jgi:uncharacterized protein (DUF433 family)
MGTLRKPMCDPPGNRLCGAYQLSLMLEGDHGAVMKTLDRITVNPDVCLGQPTIRGMRITVSVILKMLAAGRTVQDLLQAYPELEPEDVQQAMQYAAWVVSDQIQMVPAR